MKRCPECRRDYYDDSLLYCLDDGNALLDGPAVSEPGAVAAGFPGDEPETAILHETAPPSEAATRNFINATDRTAVLPGRIAEPREAGSFDKRLLLAVIAVAVILLGGFFAYRYVGGSNSAQINSIAVLPFANATGDKETDFLADGLAETLINNFTKIPDLKVAARSTAFSFRGRESDPKGLGRELGVGSVLTGRLMQRGDQLSVQVDLINTSDGAQVWGNRYEGTTAELVNIQQRIATDVSLQLKLTGSQQQQIAKTYTQNSEAYQRYLRGRFLWNKRTGDDLKKALSEFQAAADLDPNYALAYVGLADTYVLLDEYAGVSPAETLPKARAYAERALALDPSLGEAYATLGLMFRYSWNWADSEAAFARSIELNPNYPTVYHWRSVGQRDMARSDLGLTDIKRAQELDPLSGVIAANRGLVHIARGETDQAIEGLRKTIELNPSWWGTHNWLGIAYIAAGRKEEAVKTLEKAVELNRSHYTLANLAYAYSLVGEQDRARAILKEVEAKHNAGQSVAMQLAIIHAGLNDREAALTWLERAHAGRTTILPMIRWLPMFESIRDEPRFREILRKMNLTE